jgi:hypothetical protein
MNDAAQQNRKVNFKRVMLSFFFAPPLGIFLFLNAFSAAKLSFNGFALILYFSIMGCIIAYPAMLFLGLITTIIFDYNRIRSPTAYAFMGCITGVITAYLLFIEGNEQEIIESLCMAGLAGVSCALCSWFIMTYKRTD